MCTLQTATNPIIVWLRFTLFTFSVARSDRTSVVYVGYDETRAHINIKVVQGHFYEKFLNMKIINFIIQPLDLRYLECMPIHTSHGQWVGSTSLLLEEAILLMVEKVFPHQK